MKAKTIRIRSVGQALKDFAKTYHALSDGRRVKRQVGTFFASMGAARKVLTENRIQLLKTIKQHKDDPKFLQLLGDVRKNFKNAGYTQKDIHRAVAQVKKSALIPAAHRKKFLTPPS